MSWQLPAVVVLFVSLAVILHYGGHVRAKTFPEITGYSPPATVQATAKPSLLQPTNRVPQKTLAARSTDGHVTSQIAVTTSTSETLTTHTTIKILATASLVTVDSTPSTSPTARTLVTDLATPNKSHTAAPVTEATISPSTGPSPPPSTVTQPAHRTGARPSTVSHTTGKATQLSNQTTLPATLSTTPHNSTTSQKPSQPTHTPGPTNTTHRASPATIAPRPTLAPQPSSAKTGIYQVLNGSKLCIKAEMGIELTVQDTESVFSPQKYFNIDPNATQSSGNCGFRKSNLLLNFQGGFVNLTFTKAYIFSIDAKELNILHEMKGKKLGSYFGASICAVDLNADGFSDLLVGAPVQSTVREEGRVFVYINSGTVSLVGCKLEAMYGILIETDACLIPKF
ncbi:lysosome-associated membrane glycoprotein 3 [Pontoporia blainvillei]|uniref:Lysosome-associated membrane glycoprotein 3 n=1 Tax=Pontoporia blainvillei TaxID=48723 RepID=A0ABX0S5B7_PONBL|nr:lysosome-associated membrane glycoprotein 3 [Pontoporia blainvillei]